MHGAEDNEVTSGFLLALWVALISADRIDFAGGHGPFIVTPFLVLTPFLLASESIRHWRTHRPLTWRSSTWIYVLTSLVLVSAVFASVFAASEFSVSASRAVLLAAQLAGTFAVAILCADRPRFLTTIARGAIASLVLFFVFDFSESLWWVGRGSEIWRLGAATARFDQLQSIGVLPRLAGPVGDANRAGFLLLFYTFAIAKSDLPVLTRRVALAAAVILMAATISRSTAVGALAMVAFMLVSKRRYVSVRVVAGAAVALAALSIVPLVAPRVLERVSNLDMTPLTSRFSFREPSARSHVELIERGIGEGLQSFPRAAFGLGYGNAYRVLQDFFPANRYGNFHSLYVTMFAESGVLALIAMLVLTMAPVIVGSLWRPVVAGAIAFNIFYQTPAEPVFWLLLALAWLAMPVKARAAASTA